MMCDWITARLEEKYFDLETMALINTLQDRIIRFDSETGATVWETCAWESVRSDSHQIAFRATGDALWIQGSPARVMGEGCNVFGFSHSSDAHLDLSECVRTMILFVSNMLREKFKGNDLWIPLEPFKWKVSRVDLTENLLMDSLEQVRDTLKILRNCEGGRYRVSQQAGDTVYWSHRSQLKKGKAYAKGPHLIYLMKRQSYQGKQYTKSEIDQANKLLRLELTLGSQFWRERAGKHYTEFNADELRQLWHDYFDRMIGEQTVKDDDDLKNRIFAAADTEGQARGAYGQWSLIQSEGWERAKEMTVKSTWYRRLKILRKAGLRDTDLSNGQLIHFQKKAEKKIIQFQVVTTWAELKAAA